MNRHSNQINVTIVKSFCDDTKLLLPTMDCKFLDYYLDVLDPYTKSHALFNQCLQDIETHSTIHQLNHVIREIIKQIIDHISEHPPKKIFHGSKFEVEVSFLKASPFKNREKLYIEQNQNQLFISVDINKACYTTLKHDHPDVFGHTTSWEEFAQLFCGGKEIQTLLRSRCIRERILGRLGLLIKLLHYPNILFMKS